MQSKWHATSVFVVGLLLSSAAVIAVVLWLLVDTRNQTKSLNTLLTSLVRFEDGQATLAVDCPFAGCDSLSLLPPTQQVRVGAKRFTEATK